MLKNLYEIIEPSDNESSKLSSVYDIIMLICIIASMIPLAVKSDNMILNIIDKGTVGVFIIDYILRLITAKQKLDKGVKSYFLYPIQPMAIIDLLSILPSLIPINTGFKVLRLFRIVRTFKVFRSFKIFRYSKNVSRLIKVLKKQSKSLIQYYQWRYFMYYLLHWLCSILSHIHLKVFLMQFIGPQFH